MVLTGRTTARAGGRSHRIATRTGVRQTQQVAGNSVVVKGVVVVLVRFIDGLVRVELTVQAVEAGQEADRRVAPPHPRARRLRPCEAAQGRVVDLDRPDLAGDVSRTVDRVREVRVEGVAGRWVVDDIAAILAQIRIVIDQWSTT